MKLAPILAAVFGCLLLSACSSEPEQQATSANVHQRSVITMAAPASDNCARAGGTLALSHQLDGSRVGMCQLPNGKRCAEWALMQGTCAR